MIPKRSVGRCLTGNALIVRLIMKEAMIDGLQMVRNESADVGKCQSIA